VSAGREPAEVLSGPEISMSSDQSTELAPVLSIDGGGIRGIIPAMVLAEFERRAGRPIAEMFDLIAGTSTGGIIAIGLTRPGADGRPRWSAQQLVDLYLERGPRIFDPDLVHSIKTLYGMINERYDTRGLDEVLDQYCGGSTLAQSVTDVLIPAYDVVKRALFFFDSAKARADPAHDFSAAFVARATSAAPTYFEPPLFETGPLREDLVFVDGGLFANNPGMCAFAEAQRGRFGRSMLLVSLGTGSCTRQLPHDEVRHWGMAQWARPILSVVFDGVSMAIDQQLSALLGGERYWRFETILDEARDDFDDVSRRNLRRLMHQADRLIAERSADIDHVISLLPARVG
jgi:uncharacterized protein